MSDSEPRRVREVREDWRDELGGDARGRAPRGRLLDVEDEDASVTKTVLIGELDFAGNTVRQLPVPPYKSNSIELRSLFLVRVVQWTRIDSDSDYYG